MTTASAPFAWDSRYTINVRQFDEQHKRLLQLMQELQSAMASGLGQKVLGSTLAELLRYARTHFTDEELLLERHGYLEIAAHRAEHEKFTRKVEDFSRDFQAGRTAMSVSIMQFLKNWLTGHILAKDRHYAEFLNTKGIS